MSRKRRRSGELGLGPAIGMKRELECRPDRRADQLHERLAPDSSRCGHPWAPTRGLHERRRPRGHLGLGAEVGKADGVKDDLLGPEVHARATEDASSRLAVVDDPAVVDLDPRRKFVRESEPVAAGRISSCRSGPSERSRTTTGRSTTTTVAVSYYAHVVGEVEVDSAYRQGVARADAGWIFSVNDGLFRTDDALHQTAHLVPA